MSGWVFVPGLVVLVVVLLGLVVALLFHITDLADDLRFEIEQTKKWRDEAFRLAAEYDALVARPESRSHDSEATQ